ncbi:hypothetical protein [Crocinitomix catalasitica]|uniref:hypothetical protein n=1 Tax=Crocinitomix catalasitica TaxID=184607 RepID=UPI00047F39BA|nr:hypothetical protein [Crocinitomix catalasitica]
MVETYNPEIVSTFLNGAATEAFLMVKLMGQVVAILFAGIFLWRVSAIFNKKRQNRHESVFTSSRFQQHWRRR